MNMKAQSFGSTCGHGWQQRWARRSSWAARQPGGHLLAQRQRLRAVEELVEAGEAATGQLVPAAPAGAGAGARAGPAALARQGKRIAVLQASKFSSVPVDEGARPLAEYMALPASQYSVLDAKKIERLDEETFLCHVGGLRFFSFEVEPVITVSVTVQERGPTVRLLGCELRGSKAIEQANEKFSASMTNVVRWRDVAEAAEAQQHGGSSSGGSSGGGKEICSETSIQVVLEVPGWFIIPVSAIESSGSRVMEAVLSTAVPRFLQQLAADYAVWAAGGDEASRHSLALESELSFSEGEEAD